MKSAGVLLYVPNIIGYVRIGLTVLFCWVLTSDYRLAALFYVISELLDAVDGYAARALKQSSQFGAILDMLTDRCTTLCLLFVLALFYPAYLGLFQLSACLDVASHWLHMHSHDIAGSKSHKSVSKTANRLLHYYYTCRPFLFFMCLGNEAFYWSLYVLHFTDYPLVPLVGIGLAKLIALASFPVAVVKSAISCVHLIQAAEAIASFDAKTAG